MRSALKRVIRAGGSAPRAAGPWARGAAAWRATTWTVLRRWDR